MLHSIVLPRVRLLRVGLLAFGAALQIEVVLDLGAGYVRALVWGESGVQGGRRLGEVGYLVIRCASHFFLGASRGHATVAGNSGIDGRYDRILAEFESGRQSWLILGRYELLLWQYGWLSDDVLRRCSDLELLTLCCTDLIGHVLRATRDQVRVNRDGHV